MNHLTFNELVDAQLEHCKQILGLKSEEYSSAQDKLVNFKTAAGLQQCSPETALGGMLAKHLVSIYDLIRKTEGDRDLPSMVMWDEKITDAINYLLLLKALLVERDQGLFTIEVTSAGNVVATGEGRNYESCVHCDLPIYTNGLRWYHRGTNQEPCEPDMQSTLAYPK